MDAAAVDTLRSRCRDMDQKATDEEIAHCVSLKTHRAGREGGIRNWVGLWLSSVPAFFRGAEPDVWRYRNAKRNAVATEARTSREGVEEVMAMLNAPGASEADRMLAREILAC